MDILEFQANPKTVEFERGGGKMNVTFNADAFTPEFFRNAARRFREHLQFTREGDQQMQKALKTAQKQKNKSEENALALESQARSLEVERDIYAILLVGSPESPVLMEWELTRKVNGEDIPIPVNEDEIKRLKPALVKDLYMFCVEHSSPKSPEIPTTPASLTISETIDAGSSPQETPQGENPIM